MRNASPRKLMMACAVLLFTNTLVTLFLARSGRLIDGTEEENGKIIAKILQGQVISIPLVCAILATIPAYFIDRERSYKLRYTRAFLMTLAITYGLFFILIVAKGLLALF
jgi:hypothetical protein